MRLNENIPDVQLASTRRTEQKMDVRHQANINGTRTLQSVRLKHKRANKMFEDEIISRLLNCMKQAIKRGDWSVDGACDPDSAMWSAENYLKSHGWTENAIDDQWQEQA